MSIHIQALVIVVCVMTYSCRVGGGRPTTEGVAARTGADKLCSPAVDTILQVRWRFWWNSIPLIGCLRLFHEQGQHISTD